MPLRDHHQIISVDDHMIEHPKVWTDRLPQKYQKAGPRIVEDEQGHHIWVFEGRDYPQVGLNAVAGRPPQEYGLEPSRYDDMIPGCYDPAARVLDMDIDGTTAATCYPSFPGFAGGVFIRADDGELAAQCIKAWNDYSVDEWCATAPDRLIPLAMLPVWDQKASVDEVHRMAAKGAKAITFPENPAPLGLPSFHTEAWDGVFSALEDTNMPLCLRFGSSGFVPRFADDQPWLVSIALFASNLMWTAVDLLLSGSLQRHPKLKVMLAEGGIGWFPYILERVDYSWNRHRWYQDVDRATKPSDLFRKHFYGCFIEDNFGLDNRHEIGLNRITFEVDYPHSDSNWPNTRTFAEKMFREVPDDEVARIVELNAREVFNFPRPASRARREVDCG